MDSFSSSSSDSTVEIEPVYSYGGFWVRFVAQLLDTLILSPMVALVFYNMLSWKSTAVAAISTIFSLLYRIYFESQKGATPGKMIMGLRVVNRDYNMPSIEDVLKRNIFGISISLVSLVGVFMAYQTTEFQNATGWADSMKYAVPQGIFSSVLNLLNLVYVVDGIVLIADKRKQSLHDQIGGTYVIKNTPDNNTPIVKSEGW